MAIYTKYVRLYIRDKTKPFFIFLAHKYVFVIFLDKPFYLRDFAMSLTQWGLSELGIGDSTGIYRITRLSDKIEHYK